MQTEKLEIVNFLSKSYNVSELEAIRFFGKDNASLADFRECLQEAISRKNYTTSKPELNDLDTDFDF